MSSPATASASGASPVMPAFFTATSIRPHRADARRISAATARWSLTSAGTNVPPRLHVTTVRHAPVQRRHIQNSPRPEREGPPRTGRAFAARLSPRWRQAS